MPIAGSTDPEAYLLQAARNRLQLTASFRNREVRVEIDERAPAISADRMCVVSPGGVTPGPVHNTSYGALDQLIAINVHLLMRIGDVPRDDLGDYWNVGRGSDIWVTAERDIHRTLDFNYTLLSAANTLIAATGSTFVFVEPLKLANAGPVREAPAEVFAGAPGDVRAALIRTFQYRGARWMETR